MTLRSNVHIPGVPDDLAKKIAQVRGEEGALADKEIETAEGVDVSDILTVSAKIQQDEQKNIEQEELLIGQKIDGKGIYAGTWEPGVESGASLGKIFNVYAAAEDHVSYFDRANPRNVLTYGNALREIVGTSPEHIEKFEDHTCLYKTISEGNYDGQLFIPTREILEQNLYAHRRKGALAGTFVEGVNGYGTPLYYWSCTVKDLNSFFYEIWGKPFFNHDGSWFRMRDGCRNRTRPVRVELKMEL